MGKKKQPFYRVVAIDSRVARDGRYIDKIGHYNPLINPPEVLIDEEKALMWLQKGAIPSDTVKNLLSRKGIILRWDLMKKGLPKEKIDEELKKWELLQLEREKRKEALEAQRKRDDSTKAKKEEEDKEVAEPATVTKQEEETEDSATETKQEEETEDSATVTKQEEETEDSATETKADEAEDKKEDTEEKSD